MLIASLVLVPIGMGISLAWRLRHTEHQAVVEIERLGGTTRYLLGLAKYVEFGPECTDAELAAALPWLEQLNFVEQIDLSGTRVTDRSVRPLAHLRNLHLLALEDTSVSDDTVAWLKAQRPYLMVVR